MSMKNPLTRTGIEPASFRFVAQHLNHCAMDGTVKSVLLQARGAQRVPGSYGSQIT